eukprot:snap_masked-scaffold_3-processed-gene-18.37-mRNA-1 protein AED:1.00 eAED:1.00 QI:0/0/0/0/1/1/2/0/902
MKDHEIFTIPPTPSNSPETVVIPDDHSIFLISILYPLLFLLSVFIYFLLRAYFPSFYILRVNKLNKSFISEKKTILKNIVYDELSDLNTESVENQNTVLEPLLKFRRKIKKTKPASTQPFFPSKPQLLNTSSSSASIDTQNSYASIDSTVHEKLETNEDTSENCCRSTLNGIKNLFSIFFAKDMDLLNVLNLDQLIFLRMIRLIIQLLFGYMVPSFSFLLPLYHLQPQDPSCHSFCKNLMNQTFSEANRSSLAMLKCSSVSTNLASGSSLSFEVNCLELWAPVFSMCWCSILTIWLIRREYKKVIFFRNNVYWQKKKPPELYTILLDEIPENVKLSSKREIFTHFDKLFPGKVEKIDVVATKGKSHRVLEKLYMIGEQREAVYNSLQRLFVMPNADQEQISNLEDQLQELNEKFESVKHKYFSLLEKIEISPGLDRVTSVFVTFNSAVSSTIAEQTLVHEQKDMIIERAVEPSNVDFKIIGYSESNLTFRKYISRFVFFLIIIFWGTLTTFVSGITNPESIRHALEKLSEEFPRVGPLINRFLFDYGQQIDLVAPLTLIALLAGVNPFIRQLSTFHVRHSESEIDEINTFYYFIFLVIQLFLFYGIAGTIFLLLQEIIDNPKALLYTLAQTIPKNAAFYISFIITKLFTMLSMELLRVPALFVGLFRWILKGRDITMYDFEKEVLGLQNPKLPTHYYLSSTKAELLLIYFIATTYISIQPLIAPAALVFFILAYVIYGNNFMNLYLQRYDSGGQSWPNVYWCLTSALLTSQITLIAVLLIKEGFKQVFAMWIVFLATLGTFHIMDSRFKKLLKSIPLNIAQKIDQEVEELEDIEKEKNKVKVKKISPAVFHYERLENEPYYLKYLKTEDKQKKRNKSKRRTIYVYDYSIPVLNEPVRINVQS